MSPPGGCAHDRRDARPCPPAGLRWTQLADAFADARSASSRSSALSPLAVRSYETRGRLAARGGVPRPHAVPARPRPDRPLEAVPAAEGQDAGLHRPGRRPLPHAHDPHARDDRDRPRRRPRAAAERGSRRGDRARPRHRPPAVRARRRGGARRRAARALRRPLPPQRAVAADRRAAQPHRTRCATASSRTPASSEPETLEGKIVRIVDRVAYINHDIDDAIRYGILEEGDLPRDEIAVLGADRARSASTRSSTT